MTLLAVGFLDNAKRPIPTGINASTAKQSRACPCSKNSETFLVENKS